MVFIRRSNPAKADVSRDVNRELHGLSNKEDKKRLQPTNVNPFLGKYISNFLDSISKYMYIIRFTFWCKSEADFKSFSCIMSISSNQLSAYSSAFIFILKDVFFSYQTYLLKPNEFFYYGMHESVKKMNLSVSVLLFI